MKDIRKEIKRFIEGFPKLKTQTVDMGLGSDEPHTVEKFLELFVIGGGWELRKRRKRCLRIR